MIKILDTKIKNIDFVIQIADCHIRLLKRHDEFREVFQRLFYLVKETPKETLICFCGDLFHSKLDLTAECIQLAKEFLCCLSDLRPTILIAGNHDLNLANKHRLDPLSPIVEAINHPNLFYLKESGLYGLGNICINNYSIFDESEKYLKGKDIPSIYRNQYEYFICLYHGQVDGAITDLGFKISDKSMPLSMFDGHEICMLGDIHLQQTLQEYDFDQNKPYIRYCGSLCQQNHGESLKGHGYTLWNLKEKSYQHIEIPNDYGYFTIKVDEGKIKTDLSDIPKKSRIRLSLYETLPTETKEVLKKLKEITEFVEPPTYTRENVKDEEKRQTTLTENLIRGDIKNKEHQIKLITEYLNNKLGIKDEELIKTVIDINNKTNDEVKTDNIAKNIRWNPIKFEWDNLFSYGENNIIDFTKMNGLVGIFGKNALGKSSIMSSLSWCIFDKCERDFKTNNIINDQKMSCRAQLEININEIHYFIERVGKMDKKGNVKVNVKFWRMINGVEENLTGVERVDTNSTIRNYVGTYEDFLLTSLSVQRSGKYETSFIDIGDSGRKDLLAQFLGLNVFDILHEEANSKLNEIISILRVYKNEDFEEDLKTNSDALSQVELLFKIENENFKIVCDKKEQLQRLVTENNAKLIKIEGISNLSEKDIIEDIESNKHLILQYQSTLDSLQKEMKECDNIMIDIRNKIKKIEDKNIFKLYEQYQKLNVEKNQIEIELSQKVAEAKIFKEKAGRLENYQFDPNCGFCVKNADNISIEATKSNERLITYKPIIEELVTRKNNTIKKIDDIKWVEEENKTYNFLLKERMNIQEKYLGYTKRQEDSIKTRDNKKILLESFEKKLVEFNNHKESIINNIEVKRIGNILENKWSMVAYEENKQNQLLRTLIGKTSVLHSKIEELTNKISKVKEVEKQYKAYDLYVQSICRDGIPYEIICSAVPAIENEVNSILSQIVEFHAKFDVDGKNIIPYIVYDERRWLMSLGSGMEQFILSTAIRVALISLSNLPRSNFLALDEPCGVLDAENLSSMSTFFSYLKTFFDYIIIVSHIDSIKDISNDNIEITKKDGFSKIQYI